MGHGIDRNCHRLVCKAYASTLKPDAVQVYRDIIVRLKVGLASSLTLAATIRYKPSPNFELI